MLVDYYKEQKTFRAPLGKSPTIFIVDNDSGGKAVFKQAKEWLKKEVTGTEQYVKLFANLYIVPIPLAQDKSEGSIEDLFSSADIAKGFNGKPFDFSNNADRTKSADKATFAYDFVAKQAASLNWTGFYPLLSNISAVLADYEASLQ